MTRSASDDHRPLTLRGRHAKARRDAGIIPALTFATAGLVAGCFAPDLPEGMSCDDKNCPGDLVCEEGTCIDEGSGPPGSNGNDPHVDAGTTEPDAPTSRPDIDAHVPDAHVPDAHPPDADPDPEPRTCDEAGAPADINCDRGSQTGCSSGRCTLIISELGPAHEVYIGCAEPEGEQEVGEPCEYTEQAGVGYVDNCRTSLTCDPTDGVCRSYCDVAVGCSDSFEDCEELTDFDEICQDTFPEGICR